MIHRAPRFDSIVAPNQSPSEFFNTFGYKRLFGPCRRYDRFAPGSGPSSGMVRFSTRSFRFTSRSGPFWRCRRWSAYDPFRTFNARPPGFNEVFTH